MYFNSEVKSSKLRFEKMLFSAIKKDNDILMTKKKMLRADLKMSYEKSHTISGHSDPVIIPWVVFAQ